MTWAETGGTPVIPEEAKFLLGDCAYTLGNAFLKLSLHVPVKIYHFLRPPESNDGSHVNESVKAAHRGRPVRTLVQSFLPQDRGLAGVLDYFKEPVVVKLFPGYGFQEKGEFFKLATDIEKTFRHHLMVDEGGVERKRGTLKMRLRA